MFECLICNKKFKKLAGLSNHIIRSHRITTEEYYCKYININFKNNCKFCNNKTKFDNIRLGYKSFCSTSCAAKGSIESNKELWINKYGVDNPSKLSYVKDKKKKTCLKNHGVEYPLQSNDIMNKFIKTSIKNFNVDHPVKSKEIKNKMISTNRKKYNVNYIIELDNVKIKRIYSIKNNIDIINKKKIDTSIKKNGVPYYFQSKEFKKNFIIKSLEKYNETIPSKSKEIKNKISNTKKFNKYNSLFTSELYNKKIEPLFDVNTYKGIGDNKKNNSIKYLWKCKKCDNKFEDRLNNGHIPRCLKCYPIFTGTSIGEKEIYNFIKQYFSDAESRNRSIISPMELDIYIPSKQFAIEFNGLFWHSDLNGKDKNYHLNKILTCAEKNIQLIHIFEDEWIDKQEIVKSIIKHKLGLTDNKIFARKCKIKNIANKEAFKFLNGNHLQGSINGNHIGLYYNNELVSLLTYGKPRFDTRYEFEILRFCNKLNTTVVGGLSKLISQIKNKSIISYVDKRFGNGDSYKQCGFNLIRESKPSYYYIKDIKRLNRMSFQKHKLNNLLKEFDSNLTEWQNMQLNNYDRIWDCGNYIYELI